MPVKTRLKAVPLKDSPTPSTNYNPPVAEPDQDTQLHIFRHQGQFVCNECFNALPDDERQGRIGYKIGFVPQGTPKETCCLCKREGYKP